MESFGPIEKAMLSRSHVILKGYDTAGEDLEEIRINLGTTALEHRMLMGIED
jgi:hypothetical protein